MKSFLKNNPPLKLALNEDLIVGRSSNPISKAVILDDCNFHSAVDYSEFDTNRTLKINPPDGEFTLMNYRYN